MKAKKIILAALMALGSLVYAADFGGSIGTYTKAGSPAYPDEDEFKNLTLKQDEILTGWFRFNFNPSMFIAAEAEAKYRFNSTDIKNSDASETLTIFDLKTLRFFIKTEIQNTPMTFEAGRLNFTDLSGLVFSQVSDGALISADFSNVFLKASASYTGLLNAQNITILNKSDSEYELDSEKSYEFAAAYTNLDLNVEFPFLFANQTLSAEFLASLASPGVKKGSGSYNRMYGTLGLNGFLSRHICYTLTSTIGSELSDGDGISNLTKLNIALFPGFKDISISLNGIYASGDQMGFKPFVGFTSITAVNSFSEPEYSGLVKSGINASIKPVDYVLLSLYGNAIFSWPESDLEYHGTETGLNIGVQIFSDLSLNAGFSKFFAKESEEKKTLFTLSTNLLF